MLPPTGGLRNYIASVEVLEQTERYILFTVCVEVVRDALERETGAIERQSGYSISNTRLRSRTGAGVQSAPL